MYIGAYVSSSPCMELRREYSLNQHDNIRSLLVKVTRLAVAYCSSIVRVLRHRCFQCISDKCNVSLRLALRGDGSMFHCRYLCSIHGCWDCILGTASFVTVEQVAEF
jgi:hypothetical protein